MKKPPAWHLLCESEPYFAVIRYDGDPATWDRLLREVLADVGADPDDAGKIAAPEVKWYRMNVCPPDHWLGWAWALAEVDGPGRGRWQGAKVRYAELGRLGP